MTTQVQSSCLARPGSCHRPIHPRRCRVSVECGGWDKAASRFAYLPKLRGARWVGPTLRGTLGSTNESVGFDASEHRDVATSTAASLPLTKELRNAKICQRSKDSLQLTQSFHPSHQE